ncbi:MAG: potassium channel family protein [Dokdonella sp.]|uniref:potassium channel family protein n=1 Tax=Dokdonella sp. TaxID=2291710 RepID=UPI0025C3C39F|nr:potassium channel family protein [Dokdonella sp.]MBZ0224044.1 potassium channel family protein [Dokdonella sp.]
MANQSFDRLFDQHVPSAIRESEKSDFNDGIFLNLGHRVIDEFWMENKSNFVRHSTHKLDLERIFDSKNLNVLATETLPMLLKAFMAAEVELRIEPRMTIEQRKKLGTIFRQIGEGFISRNWHGHARFCFSRGAQLFGDLRLYRFEDDCWYHEAKAAMSQVDGWGRAKAWPLYLFAGFGYRPYRLLYFCLLTVAMFVFVYATLEPAWSFFQCVSVSSMNYLTALGYGDIKETTSLTQLVVILQGFLSLILNSTLFALLVRRWFRS